MPVPREVIEQIKNEASDKIDFILTELGFDIDQMMASRYELRAKCPFHDGKNKTSFCFNTQKGFWSCYSNNCHKDNSNIFGLVKLSLSQKYNKSLGFLDSVRWLADKLKIDIGQPVEPISEEESEIHKIIKEAKVIDRLVNPEDEEIAKFPKIPVSYLGKIEPAPYFLNQGFSRETLAKFMVGYCDNPRKPMYLRSYAPILDEDGRKVLGVTGRIIYDECPDCGGFHEQNNKGCPEDNSDIIDYPKWKHFGFKKGMILYNIWNAKPHLIKSGTAILTEGPKEIWWLDQREIYNTVSVLGLNLSKYHINTLIKLGVKTLVVALDNDERGQEAAEQLDRNVSCYFKLINIKHLVKMGSDLDDLSIEDAQTVTQYLKNLSKL